MLSRDHETGNPLAGLSGAQRARRGWACHLATAGCWFPYLNGTSQGPPVLSEVEGTPEDARLPARRAYSSERRTAISVVAASDS
ncbi:MAG: hypothetical protein OEV25_02800 [Deltaproteobacteria bacterium]|nr:hypothetical protein [Deltaproteobacteria bacterium]